MQLQCAAQGGAQLRPQALGRAAGQQRIGQGPGHRRAQEGAAAAPIPGDAPAGRRAAVQRLETGLRHGLDLGQRRRTGGGLHQPVAGQIQRQHHHHGLTRTQALGASRTGLPQLRQRGLQRLGAAGGAGVGAQGLVEWRHGVAAGLQRQMPPAQAQAQRVRPRP